MIHALLFDFWDTLAYIPEYTQLKRINKEVFGDTRYHQARHIFFQAHTHPWSIEEFVDMVDREIQATEEEKRLLYEWMKFDTFAVYNDTIDTLRFFKEKGYRLGIVSNAPMSTREKIQHLGIDAYVDTIIISCEVGYVKPAKEIFYTACTALQVKPEETVMIGDKVETDMLGAKNAGMRGIRIDREGREDYTPTVRTLKELWNHPFIFE
ncbi:MAG TPA: HAD-IA family hydrolase [Candidatus Kapabacteria bacterium]|nr:HAD-IA family hydrolase [Candidatus Kapabacteria bacterium]